MRALGRTSLRLAAATPSEQQPVDAPAARANRLRAALLIGSLYCAPAVAGPPFVTDDPEPVGLHAWEVNYGATFRRRGDGTYGALPGIDLNYGAYPGVQMHAQPQMAYANGDGSRAYGVGDTELGIKYRLTPSTDDERAWMLSIYPMLELPTGSARRKLGAGAHSIYLPIWAQRIRGKWTVFGGGGYWLNSAPDTKNAWAGGVTILYQFSERMQFGGELFGTTPDAVGGRASALFNVGGVYAATRDMSILLSAGRGVRNAATTNQGAVYLGIQIKY